MLYTRDELNRRGGVLIGNQVGVPGVVVGYDPLGSGHLLIRGRGGRLLARHIATEIATTYPGLPIITITEHGVVADLPGEVYTSIAESSAVLVDVFSNPRPLERPVLVFVDDPDTLCAATKNARSKMPVHEAAMSQANAEFLSRGTRTPWSSTGVIFLCSFDHRTHQPFARAYSAMHAPTGALITTPTQTESGKVKVTGTVEVVNFTYVGRLGRLVK